MPYSYYNGGYQQQQQPYPQLYTPMNPMQGMNNQNMQNMPQQQPQQPQMQIQNGGFISVRNIDEAYSYPVAPGNSVTFKDENAPYVYSKTMSFNQLDRPIFKKYRLVEETTSPQSTLNGDLSDVPAKDIDLSDYVKTSEFEALRARYDDLAETVQQLEKTVNNSRAFSPGKSSKPTFVREARKDADND